MTLPPGERRPRDAEWREWSARKRDGLIGLSQAALLENVKKAAFQELAEEDRAAVLAHLAGPDAPRAALRPAGRRPQPLAGRGLPARQHITLRLWLRYAWPWLLPLSAATFWAGVLLLGHAWILQHSVVG